VIVHFAAKAIAVNPDRARNQRKRKRKPDLFDIDLSPEGIVIRRPGRSEQRMTWERITQWEIDDRTDCVVLTLRGGGSVTPLVVKGWTLEDLEAVMREATAGTAGTSTGTGAPLPVAAPAASPTPAPSRVERRQASQRPTRGLWKPLVTVMLLGVLAAAVTVVLLQSAGIISWSFLGPVA